MQKIVFTGGGSGGHILPSIAILPEVKKHFDRVYYIGEADSMEQSISNKYGIDFFAIKCIKFDRYHILRNFAIPFRLPLSVLQARKLLRELSPDVIFCKGGYVSLPTSLAGLSLGIPVVVHESDHTLGLANKIVSAKAKYVISASEISSKDKYIILDNPIREEILNGDSAVIYDTLHLRKGFTNILVIGGSLGAKAINDTIEDCLPMLTARYNIIHLTGKGKLSDIHADGYYPIEYVTNIGDYYAVSDLVISRAGAGVVQELLALGKRAILIPLPTKCSRGDQQINAETSGYKVIEQDLLCDKLLLNAISEVLNSPSPKPNYDRRTPLKITDILLKAKGETKDKR